MCHKIVSISRRAATDYVLDCVCMFVCLCVLLLGRVALVAQRPIVIKLSRERFVGRSIGRSVCLFSALWKNGGSDGIIGRRFRG